MYKANLNEVVVPKNLVERINKDNLKQLNSLVGKDVAKKGAEPNILLDIDAVKKHIKYEDFVLVERLENALLGGMNTYVETKYLNKETKTVVAPYAERKMVSKVRGKVFDSEEGKFDLSDEQRDFLKKALTADAGIDDFVIYVADYIEELKPIK